MAHLAHRRCSKAEAGGRLVLGTIGTGKTTVAKSLAWRDVKDRRLVLVLTTTGERWPCRWQTRSARDFLSAAAHPDNRGAVLYVDEAYATLFQSQREATERAWLLTEIRHRRQQATIITQHFRSIPPIIRDQCESVIALRQGQRSCEALIEERASHLFGECGTLGRGEYIAHDSPVEEPIRMQFHLQTFKERNPGFGRFV